MAKADATLEIERIAYTVEEAAAALGINSDRMGGLVRVGAVPHILLGQRVLIGKVALEQWLTNGCLSSIRVEEPAAPVRRLRRRA